jgi:uncharacterized membrane protein YfcA
MYRQPYSVKIIRNTLIYIFFLVSTFRLITIVYVQGFDQAIVLTVLFGAPVVMGGVVAATILPAPLSNEALRKFAFSLLLLSGCYSIAQVIFS